MKPDRSDYESLPALLTITRPLCPRCGNADLEHGGTHGNIKYLQCDKCRCRFKARIVYIEPDPKYFRPQEPVCNPSR